MIARSKHSAKQHKSARKDGNYKARGKANNAARGDLVDDLRRRRWSYRFCGILSLSCCRLLSPRVQPNR